MAGFLIFLVLNEVAPPQRSLPGYSNSGLSSHCSLQLITVFYRHTTNGAYLPAVSTASSVLHLFEESSLLRSLLRPSVKTVSSNT